MSHASSCVGSSTLSGSTNLSRLTPSSSTSSSSTNRATYRDRSVDQRRDRDNDGSNDRSRDQRRDRDNNRDTSSSNRNNHGVESQVAGTRNAASSSSTPNGPATNATSHASSCVGSSTSSGSTNLSGSTPSSSSSEQASLSSSRIAAGDTDAAERAQSAADNAISCPICMDNKAEVLGGDRHFVSITKCGHVFCSSCVVDILRRKKCSLCQGKVTPRGFHRVYL